MWLKINKEHVNFDNVRKVKFGEGWVKVTFDNYSMIIADCSVKREKSVPQTGKLINLSDKDYEIVLKNIMKIVS